MADYSDPEVVSQLGKIDPELEEFLKKNPIPAIDWSDLAGFRKMRAATEKQAGPTPEQAKLESTKNIPMRDGFESEIRIHRPQDPPSKSPLVVLLFGGGFIVGSNAQLGPYARSIAKLYGATVVTLNYRLAPENKFPAAPNDTWDSLLWLSKNASSIGADPAAGFILGGISAGGNLTAVTAQRYVSEGISPPLTGLWLSIPVLFTEETRPEQYKHLWFSRKQNADAPFFNTDALKNVDGYYQADAASTDYSPFNVKGAHSGLPPSYFQVCGLDPLRDDGLIYERALRDHGVKTKLDVYPGVPHGHFATLPFLKSSQKANMDILAGFGWLLGKSSSTEEITKAMAPPGGA